jgi:hypothetical protein
VVLRWHARQRSSGCGGVWVSERGCETAACGAAAVVEKVRRCWRTRRVGDSGKGSADGGGGLKRKMKNLDLNLRLKRLRSAFHVMTGRGGRMTGRDGAASGQSPVSSWRDRTRPVRDDRTLTESGQSLSGNPTRMTGRGGGGRDRTGWS